MPQPFKTLLRHRRHELGKTQREVAATCEVTPDFISLLETGRRRISLDRIPALASALELDPTALAHLVLEERAPRFAALWKEQAA